MKPLADPRTERSSCCGAMVTYHDDVLCCKACWAELEWGAWEEGDEG